MAGICSAHIEYDSDCRLCNIDIRDAIPNYDEMVAKAEAAGRYICHACEFEYFKTTKICPLCGASMKREQS